MPKQPETHGMPPALATPTDLGANATRDIAAAHGLLADVFALYLKTKNFHWHMSGPHFRDYHLMLDDQSDQIFAMTDVLAERVRKVGHLTLHSIGEISRNQRIADNDASYVTPQDMLAELREDNGVLAKRLREAHGMTTSTTMWRPPASWRCSSTRPSGAPGSCTRRAMSRRTRHSPLRACRAADGPTGPLGVQSRRNR